MSIYFEYKLDELFKEIISRFYDDQRQNHIEADDCRPDWEIDEDETGDLSDQWNDEYFENASNITAEEIMSLTSLKDLKRFGDDKCDWRDYYGNNLKDQLFDYVLECDLDWIKEEFCKAMKKFFTNDEEWEKYIQRREQANQNKTSSNIDIKSVIVEILDQRVQDRFESLFDEDENNIEECVDIISEEVDALGSLQDLCQYASYTTDNDLIDQMFDYLLDEGDIDDDEFEKIIEEYVDDITAEKLKDLK